MILWFQWPLVSLTVSLLSVPTNQTPETDFFVFTAAPHLFSLALTAPVGFGGSCCGYLIENFTFCIGSLGLLGLLHIQAMILQGIFSIVQADTKGRARLWVLLKEILYSPALTHSPRHAVESCPIGQVAAHRASFACTPKKMSTALCRNSWWWGVICLHSTLIQRETPSSAVPDKARVGDLVSSSKQLSKKALLIISLKDCWSEN